MAQAQIFFHHTLRNLIEIPRFFSVKWIVGTVKAINRREYTKLYPSCHQFIITHTHHMSANIVAPPSITDVTGCAGKIRLEVQAVPGNNSVTGKSHRIPMTSHTGISGKCQRSAAFPAAVQIMIMIQHPKRIKPRNFCHSTLLPVQPPEVYTFLFQRMMKILQINLHKMRIRRIKLYRNLAFRVNSHLLCHTFVWLFICTDTICRMYIQCDFHSMFMKPLHKCFRIRKEILVPGISGPTAAVFGIHIIHQMPVHIHNGNRKWKFFFLETFHQFLILILRITMITAPPVSHGIAGKQRCFSTEMIKIFQTFQIAMTIPKEIHIYDSLFSQLNPSIFCQYHRMTVINHRKPIY